MKCNKCRKKKCVKCRHIGRLVLDPKGYFLVKVNNKKVIIGFCSYKTNKVSKRFCSDNQKKIIEWVKKNKFVSRKDHFDYLKKELKKAHNCIKKNKRYIQS